MTHTVYDIDPDFLPDPVTNDLRGLGRMSAAKQSFVDLLRTRFGERPWASGVGTEELLFANSNQIPTWKIEQVVEQTAARFAPDVILYGVRTNYIDNARMEIIVDFSVRGRSEDITSLRIPV